MNLKKCKHSLRKKLLISYMKKLFRPVSGAFFFISFGEFFVQLMLSFVFTATLFSSLNKMLLQAAFIHFQFSK
jgi:hypothetical protein